MINNALLINTIKMKTLPWKYQ